MPKGIPKNGINKGWFKKGSKLLDDRKQKIRKTCKEKGVGKWMIARHLSEDTKNKIRQNNPKFWLGKKLSDEHKNRIKENRKGKGLNNKNALGRPAFNKGKKGWTNNGSFKKGHSQLNSGKTNFKKGQVAWNYKGTTPENKRIRNSIEFDLWRISVFARDNWTCQKTGIKGGKLHPHHIQNFAQYPELRFAIDNGITLSDEAHREFHKKYGIRNNTKEQLYEIPITTIQKLFLGQVRSALWS